MQQLQYPSLMPLGIGYVLHLLEELSLRGGKILQACLAYVVIDLCFGEFCCV
jgi:hypothetical protein